MSKIRKIIDRMKSGEDIGLDRTAQEGRQRSINPDGSYNVERKTGRLFGNFNPYHWVITTSWTYYFFIVLGFFLFVNVLFATAYYFIGVEQLIGIPLTTENEFSVWLYCFFFSAQSFTTVGYGGIHPIGEVANFFAIIEAFIGLMTFALATGTLYGRFSRPVAKIKYSPNVLIAPFKGGHAMQFMVANSLKSSLVEVEVRVILSWVDKEAGQSAVRKFQQVNLEIDKIAMFPTSWILNHPIDEESALFNKSLEDIQTMDFEVFVLLKGFDDIFSQTIYSRYSFMSKSFVWGGKFKKPFYVNEQGRLVMDLRKVGEYDSVPL